MNTNERQERYRTEINRLLEQYEDEKLASKHFVKTLTSEELERLQKHVDKTSFNRRKYGKSSFYCWPVHPVFSEKGNGIDPWPAVTYPKNVLIADFARRT